MGVDLHTHTTVSDGYLEPEELVERAERQGLSVLAITDHDTVDGVERARAVAPVSMQVIAGAELSCRIEGREAHILAYGVGAGEASFRAALKRFGEQRVARAEEMVARLNSLGLELEFKEVVTISGDGTIARPHVARALVARGYVGSVNEAFERYLGWRRAAFVEKPRLEPREAIDLIRSAGGVASLAHPGTFRRDDLIPVLVEAGMEGLEVRHTEHSAARTVHYERMARDLDLLPTGGSDFHGTPGHRSRLGFPEVPEHWVEALVARIQARH
jgi:predicted metal-dependent phosphoesterase TrpH